MTKVKIGALVISVFFMLFAVSVFAQGSPVQGVNKSAAGGAKAFPTQAVCKIGSCNLNGGKVTAKMYPSTEWTEVVAGQLLNAKDSIKTDACSNLNLQFADNSVISLRPNTEISLEELVFDKATRKLTATVSSGDVRSIIRKLDTPSDFKIKTPAAISGARGTIYYLKVSPTSTSIYVAEGAVDFFNPITKMTYSILAGYIMTIKLDGTVDGPKLASDPDIKDWTACYSDLPVEPYTPTDNHDPVRPPHHVPENPVSRT